MHLSDHIHRHLTFVIRDPLDKLGFLQRLVSLVRREIPPVEADRLLYRLLEREEQVTTGIGHGVAIPHAEVDGLSDVCCVLAQVPGGLDFEALDASPVHVVFMLLSPPGRTGAHIRLLARIARLVDDEQFIYRIARAADEDELFRLVQEEDRRHV
jgi:mannitol/fructose-specific phosphotransferase system IIA component (Ntr-type)